MPVELIQAGGETLRSEIHKLIHSVWKRKELPQKFSIVPLYKKDDELSVVMPSHITGINFIQILTSVLLSKLVRMQAELLGMIIVGFDVTSELITYSFTHPMMEKRMGVR
jgi:hypothetical protein